jgi:hypothetical protein
MHQPSHHTIDGFGESPLPPALLRALGDRNYDKRKNAASEVTTMVRDCILKQDLGKVCHIMKQPPSLSSLYLFPMQFRPTYTSHIPLSAYTTRRIASSLY